MMVLRSLTRLLSMVALFCGSANADLYDLNGNVIPGTDGIHLRRGVSLDGIDLSQVSLVNTEVSANVLSEQQVYSTASYQAKNLSGVQFQYELAFLAPVPYQINGWDLSDQRLDYASFEYAEAAGVDFSGADLTRANLAYAGLDEASLADAIAFRADLFSSDLSNADLSNASLIGADLRKTMLGGADFSNAQLQNASLRFSTEIGTALISESAKYNQWTEFPAGFDPVTAGMAFMDSPLGDFNGDLMVDADDIEFFLECA